MSKFEEHHFSKLPHRPHSLDINPCDFWFFKWNWWKWYTTWKHSGQKIERNEELRLIWEKNTKIHLTRCLSIQNYVQMKLIKVNWNAKNMMNKEFEHDKELRLIREKNTMKIHLIRRVSIRNLLQKKSTTVKRNVTTFWTKNSNITRNCEWSERRIVIKCTSFDACQFGTSCKWKRWQWIAIWKHDEERIWT
jgi:hypothetical protein